MFENLDVMRMAQAMAVHAGKRQALIAENVAHADTPGYRARDLADFSDVYSEAGLPMKATRAAHLHADPVEAVPPVADGAEESPNGNTVSLEHQMLKAGEVKHDHDLALAIYKTSLDILRMSVGRR